MATIPQILTRRWLGNAWSITEDDYLTLTWSGPAAKPTETEIRALSSEVDAEIAAENLLVSQQEMFMTDNADALLRALSVILDVAVELYRVSPQTQKNAFDATILSRGQAVKTRIAEIRAG